MKTGMLIETTEQAGQALRESGQHFKPLLASPSMRAWLDFEDKPLPDSGKTSNKAEDSLSP